jgi:CRISPR/Cas system Type II protein with McrA/HNH and RuvC-like nuclease domain
MLYMPKRENHQHRINMRKHLYEKQNGVCVYCKRIIVYEKCSLDHIIPVVHLDSNIGDDNLAMSCKYCNINKGDQIVFSNLYDHEIYPIVDVPMIFQWKYIITNFKDKRKMK